MLAYFIPLNWSNSTTRRPKNSSSKITGMIDIAVAAIRPVQSGVPAGCNSLNMASATAITCAFVVPPDQERPEKVVPGVDDLQNDERRDGAAVHRQHDLPERAEIAAAVEPRRLLELLGRAEEKLPEEEHRERRHQKTGRDQAPASC